MSKAPLNLHVDQDLSAEMKSFCAKNRRSGKTVSSITEKLYIRYLLDKGVKLPEHLLLKPSARKRGYKTIKPSSRRQPAGATI